MTDFSRIQRIMAENEMTPEQVLKVPPRGGLSVDEYQYLDSLVKGAETVAIELEPTSRFRTIAEAALDCVARGWYVFALGERSKEPDGEFSPHGFNSSTIDPEVVRRIWTKKPNANYGIDLGRSNLTVLDFDNGRPPADLALAATLQVSTSRGTHVYYSGTVKQSKMWLNGVKVGDIKSGGGYVLGPMCQHPDGPVYTVVADAPIASVAMSSIDALRPSHEPIDISVNGPKIPRGQHDDTLTKMARKMRGLGWEENTIYNALVETVEKRCEDYGSDYLEMCEKHAKRVCEKFPPGEDKSILMGDSQPSVPVQQLEGKPMVVVEGDSFIVEKIPPRKILVRTVSSFEPVIFEQSINQIFAWRGVGKTCLGLGFVRALATAGQFLNFKCEERVHVLYIEGELPDSQIQERWKSIVGKTDGYAHLATIDKQPGHHFTSLATDAGMAKIEKALEDLKAKGIEIKVLMLDNISTLFNIGANEEEAWIPIQAWFTSLRSRGLTVFFFHHAGKQGLSRSHSKSEDMLDVSIKLEAPEEQETGHLHAVMTFDKARAGLSEKPAEIKLLRTHSDNCTCLGVVGPFCPGDGSRWEYIPVKSPRAEAEALFAQGRSISDVTHEVGAPEGTVRRWRTEWGRKRPQKLIEMPKSA